MSDLTNPDVFVRMRSRNLLWPLIGSAGIVRIVLAMRLLPNGLFDDAYITFRYAANLIKGLGFVYNSPERVLGTTSPLFTFFLAAGGRVLGPSHIEEVAVFLGILASLGTLYLSEHILHFAGVAEAIKWTFLFVLAFLPSFVSNSISGMETPIVLFLMVLSLYLGMHNHLVALSAVGILLFLSRIDTGVWLLALAIHILLSKQTKLRDVARPLALFCFGVGAWLLFTKIYFGSVVPQSVIGKAVSHGAFVSPDWNYSLTFLSAFVPAQRLGPLGLAIIGAVLLLLVPFALDVWRRYHPLRPIIYFFPIYVVLFLASHAPLFSWYLIPPKWAFYFVVVYALWISLPKILGFLHLPLKPDHVMTLLATALFALSVQFVKRQFEPSRGNVFLTISNDTDQYLRPDGRIFLEHIGLVGYRTGRYIYDYMGLVTPETTRLRRACGSEWLPRAVRLYDADVVILYDSDLPLLQLGKSDDAAWFRENYEHKNDYHLPWISISIFWKKDSSHFVLGAAAQ